MGTNYPIVGGSGLGNPNGFTTGADTVYSDGTTVAGGRADFTGSNPICIDNIHLFAGGRGATRNIQIQLNGSSPAASGGSGAFAMTDTGSARDTGFKAVDAFIDGIGGGYNVRFLIVGDGSFYFGRNGAGAGTVNVLSGGSLSGGLVGEYSVIQAPTAPQTPAVSPASTTSATVTWAAPADDGQTPNTGYQVDYSLSATFATGVSSVTVGAGVTSTVITGLTAGQTYYFRVRAKNKVVDHYARTGVASGTVSVSLGSVPGAPTGLALSTGPGYTAATWVAPASSGGVAIDGYLIEWSTDSTFASGVSNKTVGPSVLTTTVVGLPPGTAYYFRVTAHNAVGYSAASTSANAAVPARGVLDIVRSADINVGAYTVGIRSDGATSPTLTLGYTAFGSTTFVPIATLPSNAGAGTLNAPGGRRNLEVVADANGNLIVIGADAANPNYILALLYANTGTLAAPVWPGTYSARSQALSSTGDPIVQVAAAYIPATSLSSPVPTVIVLVRRAGTVGAGSLSYATLNLTNLAAGSGALFRGYGDDPAWLATPPTAQTPNTGVLDLAPLVSNGTRVAIAANGYAVIDVIDAVVSAVSAAAAGASIAGTWTRVVPIGSTAFAILTANGAALSWVFYGTNGSILGSGSLAGANSFGGAFTDQWDAYANRVTGAIVVYFVKSTAGARTLSTFTINPSTYAAGTITDLTAALGAASSTNAGIRVVQGVPTDERRVLVEADNLLTGVKSTATYSDGGGNVAPSAPTLTHEPGYDATTVHVFAWAFGDPNPLDAQVTYDLQIQRVSDSVNVVDVSAVASSVGSRSVAANTLANGIAYRWRVRTTDATGTQGAWSSYDAFSTSANGTLTVTYPATDDPAGLNVSSIPLTWSFTQPNGYLQTQRRIRVINATTLAVISDTTMQASTATSAAVTVPSGVRVAIELSIVTNAPGTPTVLVNRYLTSNYSQPMTPTLTLVNAASYVQLTVANPTPAGSQPDTTSNYIDRSPAGLGQWQTIAKVAKNGTYNDHAVASGAAYDYRVRAQA